MASPGDRRYEVAVHRHADRRADHAGQHPAVLLRLRLHQVAVRLLRGRRRHDRTELARLRDAQPAAVAGPAAGPRRARGRRGRAARAARGRGRRRARQARRRRARPPGRAPLGRGRRRHARRGPRPPARVRVVGRLAVPVAGVRVPDRRRRGRLRLGLPFLTTRCAPGVVAGLGVLVVAAAFWAVSVTADWSGRRQAHQIAQHLDEPPAVILDNPSRTCTCATRSPPPRTLLC